MIPCKGVLRHFHMCTPTVNRLCVSRDVNKMHMAEGGVPDLVWGLLRNFYFSGNMTKICPHFFYQTISMNHHITRTAKDVLWDFLTGIAPLMHKRTAKYNDIGKKKNKIYIFVYLIQLYCSLVHWSSCTLRSMKDVLPYVRVVTPYTICSLI